MEEITKPAMDVYDRIIVRDIEVGKSLGVNRTPFLFLDGDPVPANVTLGDVKGMIDRHLHPRRLKAPAVRK